MPRLANRGTTNQAPSSAASFPSFPNMDPQLAEADGGKTNAAIQRWNSQMRSRLEGNKQQDNGRFKDIQTTITRQDGYLESVWTMQAIAGPVVTGMTLFSSIDPAHNTTVSRITFQADVFQIQTATGGHKEVFSTTADEIKLGDVLTVDLANAKVYIGTGTWGNNNTAFYVDDGGNFSLKSKLTFDGTTLTVGNAYIDSAGAIVLGTANNVLILTAADTTYRIWAGNATAGSAAFSVTKAGEIFSTAGTIGGWALSATTLTASNVVINSAGTIALGTANDILIMSAADATYRIWAGDVVAGSASFSVTKAGALFSNSGTIGGFSIGANALTASSGGDSIEVHSGGGGYIQFQSTGDSSSFYAIEGVTILNDAGNFALELRTDSIGADYGILALYNGSSGSPSIYLRGDTGDITATSFTGSGASLTGINAANISTGTLSNSRLPSAISVSSLTASGQIRGATARFGNFSASADAPVTGSVSITDDGGTTRKLAVIA